MGDRRDKCKCGRIIVWDTDDNEVICKHCGTEYYIDMDEVLVYWLEEKVNISPYKTEAK